MGTIVVNNLGKAYKSYPSRLARMREWLIPFSKPKHQLKWVLQDVSFTVNPGEAVGIIGINGAGKSTLLKMITGTTQPTTGSVNITGRVAALLELGMGFHPDFTGRQNAYMAGQLLGMSVEEITQLMSEIEAFANIGDYIDQPVRVYSSGMQVRLAFAVATARRPDLLIVDEALAVGDAAFQRKCFQRIENFRTDGTSLLFVSHDIETVKRLCDKAVFIHEKRIDAYGEAKIVCDIYEQRLFGKSRSEPNTDTAKLQDVNFDLSLSSENIEMQYGDGTAVISDVRLLNDIGHSTNVIPTGAIFSVSYCVEFKKYSGNVKFGMMIKSVDGSCIYGINTENMQIQKEFNVGEVVNIQFRLQGNLVSGTYYLNVGVADDSKDSTVFMHRIIDSIIFRIIQSDSLIVLGYTNMFAVAKLHNCTLN